MADCPHHSDRCIGGFVIFGDTERAARYVFPFVDRRWRVPFVVVDLLGFPPRILEGPFRLDNYRYRTTLRLSDLRPIESVPLADSAPSCTSIRGGYSGASPKRGAIGSRRSSRRSSHVPFGAR